MTAISRQQLSQAIAQLMPNIIRGVQLDFFVKRRVTQTQLLMVLAIHAHQRSTMSALARGLHVSMPTATGIASRLVRAGYIRRAPGETDRRQVLVQLTPRGKQFIRDFQSVIRRRWEDVLRLLNAGELAAFYRVVTKLSASLQGTP